MVHITKRMCNSVLERHEANVCRSVHHSASSWHCLVWHKTIGRSDTAYPHENGARPGRDTPHGVREV